MTVDEVSAWMASQGLSESLISDEAAYIAAHYTGIDAASDPLAALQRSLGSYVQRDLSAGDRDEGGYNTDYDDPAIVTDYGTTAARDDSPLSGYDPAAVASGAIVDGTIDFTTGSPINTVKVENQAANAAAYVAKVGEGDIVRRVIATTTPPTNVPAGSVVRTTTGANGELLYYVDIASSSGTTTTTSPLVLVGLGLAALKMFGAFK